MRRVLMGVLLAVMMVGVAGARTRVGTTSLNDSSGTALSSYTITGGGPEIYTNAIDVSDLPEEVSLQAVIASVPINILYQVSTDGTTFYYPRTISGASTATVALSLSTSSVVSVPVVNAPYMRFVIQPTGNDEGTLTLKMIEGIRGATDGLYKVGGTELHRSGIIHNDSFSMTAASGVSVAGYNQLRLDFDITGTTSFNCTPYCYNGTIWTAGDATTVSADSTYSVNTMGCQRMFAYLTGESGSVTMSVYATPFTE